MMQLTPSLIPEYVTHNIYHNKNDNQEIKLLFTRVGYVFQTSWSYLKTLPEIDDKFDEIWSKISKTIKCRHYKNKKWELTRYYR